MTLSTDEWEMSRSCQRAMSSSAAWALARTTRASPQICSEVTGLRLWGMADDPFCPEANGSSASRTSVRWRWRTSSAIFSIDAAMIARVERNSACLSRWITWVEMGAGLSPSFSHTLSSTSGSRWAKVPTAPEIFP